MASPLPLNATPAGSSVSRANSSSAGEEGLLSLRFWLLNAAVWVTVSLGHTVALYFDMSRWGQNPDFEKLLIQHLQVLVPWFLITPVVFSLSRRLIHQPPRGLELLKVLGFFLVWGLFHVSCLAMVGSLLKAGNLDLMIPAIQAYSRAKLFFDAFYLLSIAGVAIAIHQSRTAQQRAREAGRLNVELAELSADLAQARLQLLKAQLDPSFFHGALGSIASMIRQGRKKPASQAVSLLSEMLRYTTLATTQAWTSLDEEVDFAEVYCGFQRRCHDDRFSSSYDIDVEAAEVPVPPLILQPLLEHLVQLIVDSPQTQPRLSLVARLDNNRVRVQLSCSTDPDLNKPQSNAGPTNVKERLDTVYSGSAAIKTTHRKGQISIELLLPWTETTPVSAAPTDKPRP